MPRLKRARLAGGYDLPKRLTNRLNASLENWLPEKRLFLRSDSTTRFIRLRPVTQLVAIGGITLMFSWTMIASSILVIDAVSAGSTRDEAMRSQSAFEARLDQLSAERDARAAEALAAQNRFSVALDQVSQMQSQLLSTEERRRELETGLGVVQSTLRNAISERDNARVAARDLGADPEQLANASRNEEFSVALDILSGELKQAATERSEAQKDAEESRLAVEQLQQERDAIIARNDEILSEVESAVAISTKPLDDVFRSVGMNPDTVLEKIRSGYAGQGGPLTPLSRSSRGDAALSEREVKARQIMVTLDQVNTYRIAMEKLPLAMPVKSSFRYSSGFGRRWGRAHEGIDMAAPVGTPVHVTGDGVVTFAGRQGAYGNLIKIEHELGTETRYAHLSRIRVKVGERVSQGDLIGDMGNTGRSTGPHLHYEVRVNGRAVDPMSFIKAAENVF
ncbi:Murein DD-endopeptidase MepM and murein hydrolase activator NlpD, contain LysM domain [Paracoccus alcaliphilus]|uniref:Murein DD-endopeptidase MepM and murein hydrolase activator NlpD, contain LysM domain n=1 Tax=Paracoccus alcaliphilus TaxID=34002 RepID=A0A1H8JN24_9RHOB|nr:Murein DD-endopeptidase MepM and murein hydrolase activator NlpD, contain LysM domain [Paracoccus alcaliphilus]